LVPLEKDHLHEIRHRETGGIKEEVELFRKSQEDRPRQAHHDHGTEVFRGPEIENGTGSDDEERQCRGRGHGEVKWGYEPPETAASRGRAIAGRLHRHQQIPPGWELPSAASRPKRSMRT